MILTRRIPGFLLVPALALFVFSRLAASPSSLIADPDRPGVDRATPPSAIAPGNDLTRLFLPHHSRITSALSRTGRVPGWDPAGFGGRPLVGNPQAGLWYPPTWIAWACWRPSALGWLTIGHLLWGAAGVYTLSRSVGIRDFASAIASGVWFGSPYVLSQTFEGHYPHVWASSWYPWAFWSATGFGSGGCWPTPRGGHWRRGMAPCRAWWLPPILALSLLTGHAQEGYYLAVTLAICGLTAALAPSIGAPSPRRAGLGLPPPDGRPRPALRVGVRSSGTIAAVAMIVLALAAVEVIPDVMASRDATGTRLQARDAGKYHVSFLNLAQLLSPRALGGPADYEGPGSAWETMLGPGWVVAVLAAIAVARSPRRRQVGVWAAIVAASTVFAFGEKFGLFRVAFALVPGMDRFRVPARSLFLAALGTSMLAGLGVEAISASRPSWRGWWRGYRVVAAAILAALAGAWAFAPGPGEPSSEGSIWLRAGARVAADPVFLAAIAGTSLAAFWLSVRPGDRRGVAVLVGLMAAAELGAYGRDLIRVSPPSRFLGHDPVGRAIEASLPRPGPYRIRARDAFYGDARAFALGLEKTNLNDAFQVAHAADLYERLYWMFGTPGPPRLMERDRPAVQDAVLERMNVALLVSDRDEARLDWPVVESGAWDGVPFTIRANPRPLPRAYVVPRAEVAPDGPEVVDRFPSASAREAVFLDRDPLPADSPRQPYTPATYESTGPDRVEVRVTTTAAGLLVVADTWMPGWSATVDGREAPILRGNRAQRVVVLDRPGSHRVVMTYTPPGFAIGSAITCMAIIAWTGGAIFTWCRVRYCGPLRLGPQ